MEDLRGDLYHEEKLSMRTCSTLHTVKSKFVIENSAGIELLTISISNDGSQYCIQEKGKTKFYKINNE